MNNIQRFLAQTSREAMAKARAVFGDSAVVLSSRSTAGGFEVVATSEESLFQLPGEGAEGFDQETRPVVHADKLESSLPKSKGAGRATSVQRDTETLAMSTLSFQDYVRERMLKRRKEAMEGRGVSAEEAAMPAVPPSVAPAFPAREPVKGRRSLAERAAEFEQQAGHSPLGAAMGAPRSMAKPAPIITREPMHEALRAVPHEPAQRMQPRQAPAQVAAHQPATPVAQPQAAEIQGWISGQISGEFNALRGMIEDRFNMLAWLGSTRNSPLQSNLMHKLIRAGFSPALVRGVLERLPADKAAPEALRWVMDVLARNLKTVESVTNICDEGGVVSLIGATGVGKTTTAAKLAAQCVQVHGPSSVGLITLDTYRVAGYEQLRAYGRMMGVVAHLAHDRAALTDLLHLLSGKRLVIIDTAGLGQKDPRIEEMFELLDMPSVKKMLVLNASSHGDTLDDVLTSFHAKSLHGVILSKVDEAVKMAPALDAVIRHQVTVRGLANGQRVPEDWKAANATELIRSSMGAEGRSAFDPSPADLGFFFAHTQGSGVDAGALRV